MYMSYIYLVYSENKTIYRTNIVKGYIGQDSN